MVFWKTIHIALALATAGMLAICILAVLAKPFVIINIDSDKKKIYIQWKSYFGIISKNKELWVKDILKLVYSVTTYGRTSISSSQSRTDPTGSRSSFYADMANGSHEYLSPKSHATSGLSKKLGLAISEYLEIPFVRRKGGSGHFQEELVRQ